MIAIFPELSQAAARGDVEQLAILARKYFARRPTAPRIDVEDMLREAGVPVETMTFSHLGALAAKDEGGRFRVVAAVGKSVTGPVRQFLLAHLLGHVLQDITPQVAAGDFKQQGMRESICPLARYTGETPFGPYPGSDRDKRADAFAAALLLPKAMLQRATEKLGSREKIASFFGVTVALLEKRTSELAEPTRPANFIEAEKRLNAATDKTGEKPVGKREKSRSKPKTQPEEPTPRGMARLREIARKLDKTP